MQTKINVKQAFGLVGEMYDLTPYRVDAKQVAAEATFGHAAGRSSTGTYADMASTTYTTFAGIFVRPKEAVSYGGTTGTDKALAATMTQPAGASVQICSMGRVNILYTNGTTAIVEGTKIYVTTAGAFTTTATNNTLVGTVVVGAPAGASASDSQVIAVQLG